MNVRVYDIFCSTAKIEIIDKYFTESYEVCYWPSTRVDVHVDTREIQWVRCCSTDQVYHMTGYHAPISHLLPLFTGLCALNEYLFCDDTHTGV